MMVVSSVLNRSPTFQSCHHTFRLQHPSPTSMSPYIYYSQTHKSAKIMQLDVIQNEQCATTKLVVSNASANKNLNMAMDTHVLRI